MKKWAKQRTILMVAAVFVLLLVGFFAWRQTAAWKESGEAQTNSFLERVDRGMKEEDRAMFEGQIQKLQAELQEKQGKGERDVNLLLRLGNAYYTIGELAESAKYYRDILSTNPNDAPALENLGQTQLEMTDYAGAEASWRRALQSSPYELTYVRLVDLINERIPEHRPQVKEILEHGIVNLGQTYSFMIRLGDWYALQNDFERAVSHYEVAVQLNPESLDAKKQLEAYRVQLWKQRAENLLP